MVLMKFGKNSNWCLPKTLTENKGYGCKFLKKSNYESLTDKERETLQRQINDIIKKRYTFI